MKTALTVVLAALALSACGAVGSAAPPTPSASPPAGRHFDVVVSDKTRTATVKVGQTLEAVLHANPGMTTWSGVRSSDPSVLAPIVDPAATAALGVTLAAFRAIAPGRAEITATAGAACSPGQACPQYALLLTIEVTVIAS
jgi:phage tail protein X